MWLLGKHFVSYRNFSTSERWMTPLGGSQNPQLFRVSFYTHTHTHTRVRLTSEEASNRRRTRKTQPGVSGCHLRYDVAQPLGVDKVKVLELKRRIVKVQQNSCREKQPDEMRNATAAPPRG